MWCSWTQTSAEQPDIVVRVFTATYACPSLRSAEGHDHKENDSQLCQQCQSDSPNLFVCTTMNSTRSRDVFVFFLRSPDSGPFVGFQWIGVVVEVVMAMSAPGHHYLNSAIKIEKVIKGRVCGWAVPTGTEYIYREIIQVRLDNSRLVIVEWMRFSEYLFEFAVAPWMFL